MRLLISSFFALGAACGVAAEATAIEAAGAVRTEAASAPSPVPLSRENLLGALARDLAAHFNLEGELQLELLRPWAPPARLAAAWSITILDYPAVPSASMLVRARVAAEGALIGEFSLVLRASHWRDVWTTRQPLTAGTTFDPTQLEARRVDLFRERDVVPAAVGDRSFIFARAVAAGRTLTWRDIARRPLVKKGTLVDVSAVEGLLVLTLKGLAMENGAQGDTVTIRNPESQKNIAAVVVDENRVQVRF